MCDGDMMVDRVTFTGVKGQIHANFVPRRRDKPLSQEKWKYLLSDASNEQCDWFLSSSHFCTVRSAVKWPYTVIKINAVLVRSCVLAKSASLLLFFKLINGLWQTSKPLFSNASF